VTTLSPRLLVHAALALAAGVMLASAPAIGATAHAAAPTSSVILVAAASSEDVTYYEVQTNPDGEPEFLFEIAERYLGNGNRYTEIFELNEGRPQAGGGALTDPTAVQPGWILILPDDAEGDGVQVGPLPAADSEPSPGTSAPATTEPAEPGAPDDVAPAPDEASGPSVLPLVIGIIAGVVVLLGAAGLVFLLIRRNRRREEQPFDDSLLRTDTSSSWIVDRALHVLLSASAREGITVPGIVGVYIEGSNLRLRLTSPGSPAPAPWAATEDGLSWSAPITVLQRESIDDQSTDRFARLVTLGIAESGRVLVDFSRARGVISLSGPTALKHEVLRRWLGELTGNPWTDHPRVVMIGNGLPQPDSAEHLASLEQLLPELETESSGVLVLSQRPSAAQESHLAARFASPRFGWTVILLDDMSGARWRFTVAEDRWLRSDFLPDIRLPDRPVSQRKNA
jgi:hypothetical protein